jgi:8-oxo-dGTP diphosphatase
MGAQDQGISGEHWMVIPRTLGFIAHGDDVLLMKRAAHRRVFPGLYGGIGGHLERDEDPLSGMLREIQEETGLAPDQVSRVQLRGLCHIDAGQEVGIILFVFTAMAASRQVKANEEGSLHWVPLSDVNSLPVVDDLPILLPRLFGPKASGSPFFAHVRFDGSDQRMMTFAGEETPRS